MAMNVTGCCCLHLWKYSALREKVLDVCKENEMITQHQTADHLGVQSRRYVSYRLVIQLSEEQHYKNNRQKEIRPMHQADAITGNHWRSR